MGSVSAYESAHGRRYRVRYRKPDKTQTDKRGFTTKREVQLFLASVELDKAQGGYIDPSRARVSTAEWMEIWISSRSDVRASTRERIQNIIHVHINPKLGNLPLGELTRLGVQQWASKLPGEPATVRKIVLVLSGALKLAVEDGRIASNPAASLRLAKVVQKRKRYLTHAQVGELAHAVGQLPNGAELGYDILVLVLGYCGLRWGEATGLRVKDVDLETGRLNIEVTVVMVRGNQGLEAPKDYEHRSIPIPDFLIRHLARQVAGRSPKSPVFYGQRTGTWLRNQVFRVGWFDPARGEHRPRRPDSARDAAHRGISGDLIGCERESRAADARPRQGEHHARRVRRPVRGRPRCRGELAECRRPADPCRGLLRAALTRSVSQRSLNDPMCRNVRERTGNADPRRSPASACSVIRGQSVGKSRNEHENTILGNEKTPG
ncbi:MAG TPA: tyrosine-type recombinase/integrase [Microbacterium sp.]|nr:tyrosine-type recombinase/integrase [Microbacterium sp.]